MYEALIKKVNNMDMQLKESREHGEEYEFIDDFADELVSLLSEVERVLNKYKEDNNG
jgi:hypothetical protein